MRRTAFKNGFLCDQNAQCGGTSPSYGSAKILRYVHAKCRYMDQINRRARRYLRHRHARFQFHDRAVYDAALSAIRCAANAKGWRILTAWASTFGETVTAIELAPEGTGYRARTRFAKFFNLPELMAMFKEVADIKTADQLHLPVPERAL